jgi:hypothetical protein
MPTVESVAERIRYEGEWVTFVRNTDAEPITATVKAFVRGYAPNESPGDLVNAGWPDAPREPDQVEIGSARAVVQDVETRTLRGVDCIHIIHVRGG